MDISMMIGDVKFNYRVGLFIEKDDKILIECSNIVNFSVLPGGRVKTLENSVSAIKREIKEEMGVDISDSILESKALIQSFFLLNNIKYHELFFVYKLKLAEDDNRFDNIIKNLDSDSNYYKWIEKNKLKENNLLPNALNDIIDVSVFKIIFLDELIYN